VCSLRGPSRPWLVRGSGPKRLESREGGGIGKVEARMQGSNRAEDGQES
jgi:hypothetical protein